MLHSTDAQDRRVRLYLFKNNHALKNLVINLKNWRVMVKIIFKLLRTKPQFSENFRTKFESAFVIQFCALAAFNSCVILNLETTSII